MEGLPGLPDNIQEDGAGGFYVTLVIPVDEENSFISIKLAPHPMIRRFLTRLLYFADVSVKFIDDVFTNYYTKQLKYWVSINKICMYSCKMAGFFFQYHNYIPTDYFV